MDKKAQNILRSVFWGAVSVVLIWLCLRAVDWAQFGAALRQCRWGFVLLSMLLGVLVFWLRGLRWRMLLLPIDPSSSRVTCFNAYNICMAVNLVLPRAGEVVRLGYVVKHSGLDGEGKRMLSFDKALGTLLTERVWDALVTLAMGAALLIFKWDDFGAFLLEGVDGLGGSATLWWILGGTLLLGAALVGLSYAFRDKEGFLGRLWGFLKGIWNGLGTFVHMKDAWLFLLYTAAIWTLYWLMSESILWALQDIEAFAELGPADAFFLMVAGSISSVVPVPGGFGAYHGMVSGALLSIWGIPLGTGMVYATLNHESQVLTQALSGLASYIHETFIRRT